MKATLTDVSEVGHAAVGGLDYCCCWGEAPRGLERSEARKHLAMRRTRGWGAVQSVRRGKAVHARGGRGTQAKWVFMQHSGLEFSLERHWTGGHGSSCLDQWSCTLCRMPTRGNPPVAG